MPGKLALGGILSILILLIVSGVANAHFNFFLPEKWHMDTAETNEVEIIWGHPYEGLYFDAPSIKKAGLIKPDGSKVNLTPSNIEVTDVEGSKSKAYKLSFTPSEKGDYIIYADMEALEVDEEEIIWEDHVKAIIQYKTTGGWDQSTGQVIEIIPLVRPYGLEEGFVFVGQALYLGKPLSGAPVEIEKYYPVGEAPDPLPEWEPMITREATTDPNGVFSFTLDEPGIWVTAVANTIPAQDEGEYDKDIRGILMIPVEETFPEEDSGSAGQPQDLSEIESKITALEEEDNDLNTGLSGMDSRVTNLEKEDKKDDDNELAALKNMVYAALGIGIFGVLIAIVAFARKK